MDDYEDYRCLNCDARYCGYTCHADTPGYVYVVGHGWTPTAKAEILEAQNYRVYWPANAGAG